MESAYDQLREILGEYYHEALVYLPRVAMAIIVIALGYLLATWLARTVRRRLTRHTEDSIAATFLTKVARILLIFGVVLLGL